MTILAKNNLPHIHQIFTPKIDYLWQRSPIPIAKHLALFTTVNCLCANLCDDLYNLYDSSSIFRVGWCWMNRPYSTQI
jgi:hypothetical protein